MKLKELASKIVIDPRKLTKYVLDPSSKRGADKARLFSSMLGYTQANYEPLLQQIRERSPDAEVHFNQERQYGNAYYIFIVVDGSNGEQARVRVGWFVPHGIDEVRLASAWPLTSKRRGGVV